MNYLRAAGDRRLAALRRFALSITAFNLAGHLVLGFEQPWLAPLVALAAAYTFELGLETVDAWATRRAVRYRGSLTHTIDFLLPAHISALAISMLLYANQRLLPLIFAVGVAAASKYLFRATIKARSRHVLNPSNTGIAVTLVLLPSVGISPPYHFTENISGLWDWAVPLAVLTSGIFLNWKLTGKLPLILAWLAAFAAQAVIRSVMLDATLVAALLPMTGLAFLLFTTYMITDPGTTPTELGGQLAFGAAVGAVYGVLVAAHIVFGLFFSLVLVSALRGAGLHALAFAGSRRQRAAASISAAPEAVRP